jgi:ABC-type transport system involved in multi-copper enzyme maturation permease subunit
MATTLPHGNPPASTTDGPAERREHPQFLGMLRGEIFKLVRQRFNWLTTLGFAGVVTVYYLFALGNEGIKAFLRQQPLVSLTSLMEREGAITRVFIGIVLMIATGMLIGFEYQHGTIRVLLSRGVDRVKLLLAKLTALSLFALALLAFAFVWNVLLATLIQFPLVGNLDAYQAITSAFWGDTWSYLLTILISMGATILLATALTVFGRSVAFGVTAAFAWFFADNIGPTILSLVYSFTNNDVWRQLPAYWLGPTLNYLPKLLVGKESTSIGAVPALVARYDLTHALVVTLLYSVVFFGVALVLAWRRDVQE